MSVTRRELKSGRLPETIIREDIYELARKGELRKFLANSFGEQNAALVNRILAEDGPTRPAQTASKFSDLI